MPAKRKSSPYTNYPLIAIGCLVVVLMLFAVAKQNTSDRNSMSTPSTAPVTQSRTFTSSPTMGSFTITIPEGFEVEEKFGVVKLTNSKGAINITQNGSDFKNLNDHIKFMEKNNRVNFTNTKYHTLNGFEMQSGFIGNQMTIFIYRKTVVYSISSNIESLFNSVEQISQSFRLPDY